MDLSHLITVQPGKRSGQPCVRGMTVEGLLADFPELTPEDVRACLAYAASRLPGSAA